MLLCANDTDKTFQGQQFEPLLDLALHVEPAGLGSLFVLHVLPLPHRDCRSVTLDQLIRRMNEEQGSQAVSDDLEIYKLRFVGKQCSIW